MKTRITTLALMFMMVAGAANSQCKEFKWPDDEDLNKEAKRRYTLQTDNVKSDLFAEAIAPSQWLLKNTPKLNDGIYINAEKAYRGLIDGAKDEAQKRKYTDSLMAIYDMRIASCGEEESITDKKTIYAFLYYYQDKDTLDWLLDLSEHNLDLNGKDAFDNNLKYYFRIVQLNKVYLKNMSDDDMITKFNRIQGLLDERIAAETEIKEIDDLKKAKEGNVEILAKTVKFDCDKVREILGPKLKENPNDIQTAEMIFIFMRQGECTDDPLWLDAVKVIHENKPSYITAKVIGSKCLAADDIECAEQYFEQGLTLASTDEEKADLHNYLGSIDRNAGNFVAARSHYRETTDLNANDAKKAAYKYIAIMYMNSFETCKKGQSQAADRAVYIAAYNMYKRAGDAEGMASAKAQFPTVSNLFEQNMAKGDNISTGCWINETVQLDTRD